MDNSPPVIRCDGVTKMFDGIPALAGLSVTFPPSGSVGIIGPNGAGKTTLFNVFSGFIRPDAGACYLAGIDITQLSPYQIARLGVARTFQDLRLVSRLSVLDNVLLARPNQQGETLPFALLGLGLARQEAFNRESATALLRRTGLELVADDRCRDLSYGQQKLLVLACCLATDARVFLLDEPFAGLNPEAASAMVAVFRELRDGGSLVIFIEHDIGAVRRLADHVLVMDQGRIVAQGNPKAVLDRPEILEAYLG